MNSQCPTCGHVNVEWTDPESKILFDGNKALQRPRTEDRTARYRDWRLTFGGGAYAMDVDQVEYRRSRKVIRPVAVLEISRVDGDNKPLPTSYLRSAWGRFSERDPQMDVASQVASGMGVPGYFVLFRYDLSEFWVHLFYPNSPLNRWIHMGKEEYRRWVIDEL